MRFLILALTVLLCACVTPVHDNWVPSPNFNERKPNYVIIHQTDSVSHARALNTLTDPARGVSAHYLIAKDGRITQLVDEKDRAWHAGKSWWGGQTDMNSASIGIELDHQGDHAFEPAQIDALLQLLHNISDRHKIPVANFLGHGDVAIGRKVDPNHRFPWATLAARGFGLWCSADDAAASPQTIDSLLGLQALGYDTSQPDVAAQAFLRHFRSRNDGKPMEDGDLRVLACLVKKRVQPAAAATGVPSNTQPDVRPAPPADNAINGK